MGDSAASPFDLDRIASGLPAGALIDELTDPVLRRAVIQAPPGTGKTTVVPPAVASAGGRVIVTQPRRIAARAAASRLASLSGTELGNLVGYSVRGDRRVSEHTLVEFVTTGVMLQRLRRDPELTGVSAVILDEVHERAIESDLAFALCEEVSQLRDDLRLIVMSATLDAQMWASLLTGERTDHSASSAPAVPVLTVLSDIFPLTTHWAPPPVRALTPEGTAPGFLDHVAHTVAETAHGFTSPPAQAAAENGAGVGILVFLPGQREITRVAGALADTPALSDWDVRTLTGGTPLREQAAITGRSAGKRIIVASNVAESAVTVPGVRVVVDAGLDRQQRVDTRRGLAGLITVGASKAALVQRAGRAHREGPGTVIRCMAEAEFAARPEHTPPEVLTSDLSSAIFLLTQWGAPRGEGLALPTPLPSLPVELAEQRLRNLGFLDDAGALTPLGQSASRIPADPGLARSLIEAPELLGPQASRQVAEAVAALASDIRSEGADLVGALRGLRSGRGQGRPSDRQWKSEADRLHRLIASGDRPELTGPASVSDERAAGVVVGLAFPERIARRRPGSEDEYVTVGGTGARLHPGSAARLREAQWLAVAGASVDNSGRRASALIRTAAPIDIEDAELIASPLARTRVTARLSEGKVKARRTEHLGAIELSSTPITPSAEAAEEAIRDAIREHGFTVVFGGDEGFSELRARMRLVHSRLGSPWPAVDDESLNEHLTEWLAPEISRLSSGDSVSSLDLSTALRRLLPWPQAGEFDSLVPERLPVPSGSNIRVRYPRDDEGAHPVMRCKLQECFGLADTPTVLNGTLPVTLHLLSPAGRPLAVTSDLRSFWDSVYPSVRAENRGRYSKHPWPEDPWNAVATAATKKRMTPQK